MAKEKIVDLLGLRACDGDVGVEIEMEGKNRFPYEIDKYWKAEEDGSLRGHSVEYVMRKPLPIDKVDEALEYLKEVLVAAKSKPVYSERAGVHVHVNVQQLTLHQTLTMAFVYYCLEYAMVRYCGENREGNHFCLRAFDAEGVIHTLENVLIENNARYLDDEEIRYASLNFCSLFKYGSLEFRAMETQPDFSKISEWSHMLVKLRDYAAKNEEVDILFEISSQGPTGWARSIFGEELFKHINFDGFDRSVMRCMRPVQHLFHFLKGIK